MQKKILYITTIGSTMIFFESLISDLIKSGWQVDIATNTEIKDVPEIYRKLGCKVFPLSCTRSVSQVSKNLNAIKQIKTIIRTGDYDIVHCHTPIAGFCTRVACKKFLKKGLNVFYTAHGFHFFKGAPLKNWLLFYPAEWLCAWWTDVLITINKEDYARAKKHLHARCVEYVHGVGIDIEKFKNSNVDIAKKRKELGLPQDAKVVLSVGELNKNKNHEVVIKALAKIKDENMHYVIVGKGGLEDHLQQLADNLGFSNQLYLLGYRNDIAEIYKIANLYIHPSFREGLPVAPMEAIASGLPVLLSDIRGCRDLCNKRYLFNPVSVSQISTLMIQFFNNKKFAQNINLENFSVENVNNDVNKIYNEKVK